MSLVKYLCLFLMCVGCNGLIVIDNDNKVIDFVDDVIKLNSKSHPAGYFVVIYTNERTNLANKVLAVLQQKQLKETVVINTYNELENFSYEINTLKKYLGYVKIILIFASSSEDIPEIINMLHNIKISSTRTKILVIFETVQDQQKIHEIFQRFWTEFYLNVSLINLHGNDFSVLTFNPYWNQNLTIENVTSKNIFYNKLKNVNKKKFQLMLLRHDDFSKFYYSKLPNGKRHFFGTEITLFQTLAEQMNGGIEIKMSDDYLLPNERNPWRNGNFETAGALNIKLRILKQGNFDFLTSEEYIVEDNLRGATESLYPHANDDLLIVMRKGRPLPHYKYIKFLFTQEVWYSFLSVLIISTITWIFISKSDLNTAVIKFINLIRMLTGGGIGKIPDVLSERIFIIFWTMFSLIIITAFTSKLASTFMEIIYEKNIDTLDELNEKGYRVYGYKTMIKPLLQAFNGTPRYELYSNMGIVPDKYDHPDTEKNNYTDLMRVFVQQHPILLDKRRLDIMAKFATNKFILHVVKESQLPNFVAFQVPLGSPYYDRMNVIIRRFIESGIYKFWVNMHEIYVIRTRSDCPEWFCFKIEKMTPLSLRHFQAAYIILFFGLMSSLVTFIIEMIFFKINNKRL